MSAKPVYVSDGASAALRRIVDHHLRIGPPAWIEAFHQDLAQSLEALSQTPEAGSPAYAEVSELDGLRCWQMKQSAHLLFYRVTDDAVHVVQVIPFRSDLQRRLGAP